MSKETNTLPGMTFSYPGALSDEVREVAWMAGMTQKSVREIVDAKLAEAAREIDLRHLVAKHITSKLVKGDE